MGTSRSTIVGVLAMVSCGAPTRSTESPRAVPSSSADASCKPRRPGDDITHLTRVPNAATTSVVLADLRDLTLGELADTKAVKVGPQPRAPMSEGRLDAAAVVLSDRRVLVSGGRPTQSSGRLASAEIYDVARDRWTSVAPMSIARFDHALTLLADGRVLATGGKVNDDTYVLAPEIYNPATNRWTHVPPATNRRADHVAVLLADGTVLVVGGSVTAVGAEIYDPGCDRWLSAGSTPAASFGGGTIAAVLGDGRVLAIGSSNDGGTAPGPELRWKVVGAIYDPVARTWSAIAPLVNAADKWPSLRFEGERVVRCASVSATHSVTSPAECAVYDPASNRWLSR